jgi:hypothetical protein
VGAPRPAASPFLAHDHCARHGCERSPSRQAKRFISRRRWLSSRRAEVARSPIGKKIAFVQCAASAASVFSVYSAWRPRIEYFSPIVAEGSQNSVRKSRSILILRKKAAS